MKKSSALAYVGHNERGDREKNDFYPTPESATQALLDRQKFQGNVWECACGNGAMSKLMIKNGYDVYSSDLIDRGYGDTGIDFLKSDKKGGLMCFAWFVFDINYNGKPTIDWI